MLRRVLQWITGRLVPTSDRGCSWEAESTGQCSGEVAHVDAVIDEPNLHGDRLMPLELAAIGVFAVPRHLMDEVGGRGETLDKLLARDLDDHVDSLEGGGNALSRQGHVDGSGALSPRNAVACVVQRKGRTDHSNRLSENLVGDLDDGTTFQRGTRIFLVASDLPGVGKDGIVRKDYSVVEITGRKVPKRHSPESFARLVEAGHGGQFLRCNFEFVEFCLAGRVSAAVDVENGLSVVN